MTNRIHRSLPPREVTRDLPPVKAERGSITTARIACVPYEKLSKLSGYEKLSDFSATIQATLKDPEKSYQLHGPVRIYDALPEPKKIGHHYRVLIAREPQTWNRDGKRNDVPMILLRPLGREGTAPDGRGPNSLTPSQTKILLEQAAGLDDRELTIYNPVAQEDLEFLKTIKKETLKNLLGFIKRHPLPGLPISQIRVR